MINVTHIFEPHSGSFSFYSAFTLHFTQVNQFKEDFNRERQDRERAFGEIDKLKKELENTKLLLHQQSEVSMKPI